MSKKYSCPIVILILLLVMCPIFLSCGTETQPDTTETAETEPPRIYTADDLTELVLTVDREEITYATGETIAMTVAGLAEDGTEIENLDIEYFAGRWEIGMPYFYPVTTGEHNLYAVANGIRSNVVTVNVNYDAADTAAAADESMESDAYAGYESDLPVIIIDPMGKVINNFKDVKCTVRVYGNEGGGVKLGQMPDLVTNGEIKIRGQSSSDWAKKQYSLHTINEDGSNNNIKLLGFPKENDWVLNGSYADKSLIRNGLAQTILAEVMDYTSRTDYCEVYIVNKDGTHDYLGVYTLLESIKVDKNRVDIEKLTEEDNALPEITGGYIVSFDKPKNDKNQFDTELGEMTIAKPSKKNITDEQDTYIKEYLTEFAQVLRSDKRDDEVGGVRDYLDLDTVTAPFIINEFLRNVDGFVYSTYFYKDRDGILKYGPGWDFDLSMGNPDYSDAANPEGWYVVNETSLARNLMRVDGFPEQVIVEWKELRTELLTDENIDKYIDDQLAKIGEEAIARQCARWPELWDGTYIWPNYNYGEHATFSHAEEVEHVRTFLHTRAKWMDEHIDELLTLVK